MNYQDYAQTQFEKNLLEALATRRQEILESLGTGSDINDIARYKHWTGYIKCLTEVVEIMKSVKQELNRKANL
jgi:hypothetical protein